MRSIDNCRMARELLIGEETGKRYSWRCPSCPDLEQHLLVDRLLDLGAIGVTFTDGYQFDPEQTMAVIIVPHPIAMYFALLHTGGDPPAVRAPEAAVAC